MNLFLDTCTFLRVVLDPSKLSTTSVQLFTDPSNTVYLSAVSAWEIAVEHRLGQISLQQSPARFIPDQRSRHGIDPLGLSEDAVRRH